MADLPKDFPFRNVFSKFLAEYAHCTTYWYVPKARTLNDENISAVTRTVIEGQIAKFQYPNPSFTVIYSSDFGGILPIFSSCRFLKSAIIK